MSCTNPNYYILQHRCLAYSKQAVCGFYFSYQTCMDMMNSFTVTLNVQYTNITNQFNIDERKDAGEETHYRHSHYNFENMASVIGLIFRQLDVLIQEERMAEPIQDNNRLWMKFSKEGLFNQRTAFPDTEINLKG